VCVFLLHFKLFPILPPYLVSLQLVLCFVVADASAAKEKFEHERREDGYIYLYEKLANLRPIIV